VLSITTVAATSFVAQQQMNIWHTSNLINSDQAGPYAEGGEAWAKL
jgi:type II secretory pathway component PulK